MRTIINESKALFEMMDHNSLLEFFIVMENADFPEDLVKRILKQESRYSRTRLVKHRRNWKSHLGRPYVKLAFEAVLDNKEVKLPAVKNFEDPLSGMN